MTKARDISNLVGSDGIIDNTKISLDANEVPSLDTAKITTGTFASARINNASLSAITALPSGVGGTAWQSVQTTGFTAVAGRGYPCNTTSSAFTVTLPASPSVGDTIILLDYAGTFATNNLNVTSTLKINGSNNDILLTTNREATTLVYVDVTQGWVASSGVNEGTAPSLTDSPPTYSVDFLVVAGGGGTMGNPANYSMSGGGGAGGFRTSTQTVTAGTAITVTVGDGGAAGPSSGNVLGGQGSDSSISGSGLTTITSAGGGRGGGYNGSSWVGAASGGSGGGGGYLNSSGGAGNTPSTSPSQGNNGGNGAGGTDAGAGGGGAGSAGTNNNGTNNGANGGNGSSSSITGSSVTYAGGGGGGAYGATVGTGGTGGGGTGTDGTANTGGGGGGKNAGSGQIGTAGGKGVVILSVPTASYSGTITGSPTVTTKNSGADTVLTFTGSGSYTT